MNRLWRRRVPMEQFVLGWALLAYGVLSILSFLIYLIVH